MNYNDQKLYTVKKNPIGDFFIEIDNGLIYCGADVRRNIIEQASHRILQDFFDTDTAKKYFWEFGVELITRYGKELDSIYSPNFQEFKICGIIIKEIMRKLECIQKAWKMNCIS